MPSKFSPDQIGNLAFWFEAGAAKAAGVLFQDSAQTTPVASDGDPVGFWGDLSGNGYPSPLGKSGGGDQRLLLFARPAGFHRNQTTQHPGLLPGRQRSS